MIQHKDTKGTKEVHGVQRAPVLLRVLCAFVFKDFFLHVFSPRANPS
jgi:hypothetical protein